MNEHQKLATRALSKENACIGKLEYISGLYEQLINAVGTKFPDESRHQTALKYIRQAEARAIQGEAGSVAMVEPVQKESTEG